MLKMFLKQVSLHWVGVASFLVLLISMLLASWFISNRETDSSALHQNEKEGSKEEDILPKLTRIDPVKVGYVRELSLVPGKVHKMRTLSLRPALFEIENFLTEQECNDIILMAQTQGLEQSKTFGEVNFKDEDAKNETSALEDPAETFKLLDLNNDEHLDAGEVGRGLLELGRVIVNEDDTKTMISALNMDLNEDGVITYDEFLTLNTESKLKEMRDYLEKIHESNSNKRTRDSSTAFLDPYEHIDFRPLFESLRDRIHLVTQLPKDMIWSSENMQVIRYNQKQHYHCHFDSEEEETKNLPCCHHVEMFYDGEDEIQCVPCRFLTLFYYLNEPKLGGETAFPIADNETLAENETYLDSDLQRCDLAEHCYDANLYYKPKRGAALLWYNHFVSNETGWLGRVDQTSYHGGCNVIEGTKWAANNWINAGIDRKTDLKFWEEIRLMEEDYQERMRRVPWEEQTGAKESSETKNTIRDEETRERENNKDEKEIIEEETKGNERKENDKKMLEGTTIGKESNEREKNV